MGAIFEEIKNAKREELSANIEELAVSAAREELSKRAVSSEQRVRDIESNLESARQEQQAVLLELAEIEAQG